MKSSCPTIFWTMLILVILILGDRVHPIEARRFRGSRGRRTLFLPITSPTTEDTCATDYGDRDNNGLVELNRRFTQDFLENIGVGNNFTVCFGRMQRRNSNTMIFRVKSFQVETSLRASKIQEEV
ncbi:uncharacterized protein LOC131888296 [Tigriopus californicus]|uniref:uncharacterized protein LOC131888296 n=1 Tax=Tigriopus californicus TaxID=6832 RepID=UPI0027DA12BB|nr:uncharacterized protein LOC131888296 [Tigriopus californicus]